MTLLIGSDGSMGRRYQAILNYLKEPFQKLDIHNINSIPIDKYDQFDRFIIATPTHTHFRWVMNLDHLGKPILCEKPLSTDLYEVVRILDCKSPLSMTMQYMYFDRPENEGHSWYNFYNHGKDGLYWDCFQILALARSIVHLDETSPIWSCGLNGSELDLRDMDSAYIWVVENFLKENFITRAQMLHWHQKVTNHARI